MAASSGRTAGKQPTSKPEQALIALEGSRGRTIGELCAEREISQGRCYECVTRPRPTLRERPNQPHRQHRLGRENGRSKRSSA